MSICTLGLTNSTEHDNFSIWLVLTAQPWFYMKSLSYLQPFRDLHLVVICQFSFRLLEQNNENNVQGHWPKPLPSEVPKQGNWKCLLVNWIILFLSSFSCNDEKLDNSIFLLLLSCFALFSVLLQYRTAQIGSGLHVKLWKNIAQSE